MPTFFRTKILWWLPYTQNYWVFQFRQRKYIDCWAGIGIFVLELLRYKGFRAEAKSNKGFGKGWEAEYLAQNKGF